MKKQDHTYNKVSSELSGKKIQIMKPRDISNDHLTLYGVDYGTIRSVKNKLEALEIIIKKDVDVFVVHTCSKYGDYNICIKDSMPLCKKLTKEDWEILKPVIGGRK